MNSRDRSASSRNSVTTAKFSNIPTAHTLVRLLCGLGLLLDLFKIRWFGLLGHDHEDRGQGVVRNRGDVVLDLGSVVGESGVRARGAEQSNWTRR